MPVSRRIEAYAHRARLYRLLSWLFAEPQDQKRLAGCIREAHALKILLQRSQTAPQVTRALGHLTRCMRNASFPELRTAYTECFESSGRLQVLPNETAWVGRSPQEALLRTYRLADIAGFYKAFGVEVAEATERVDHIAVELEFMHLLSVKTAVSLEQKNENARQLCERAATAFLRDHLLEWASQFAERLQRQAPHPVYRASARVLTTVLASEGASIYDERRPARRGKKAARAHAGQAR